MGFFSPILAMNSYYSMSTLQNQRHHHHHPQEQQNNGYGDYYSLPRQKFSSPPPSTAMMSGTPVILNVFAPAAPSGNGVAPTSNYCTLQSVHYGTLPIKRTNSIKASTNKSSSEKSTPGLDQIMKWVKNKREKYKSSRRSSASAVSNSSTLKEAPPGILRNSRRNYANYFLDSLPRPDRYHQHQQQQQYHQQHPNQPQQQLPRRHFGQPTMSLPPTNRQWSTLRRTSDAFYGYDPVFDEDDDLFEAAPSFDSYRDYYPTATLERLERYEPSLPRSRRSSIEAVPMLHRYPPSYIEPPIDYSCSSNSSTENDSPGPAQKVRFQFPKPEDVQYINTTADTEKEDERSSNTFSPTTLQKFEKIYQKFKPNFIKKSAKKTDSIDSTEDTPSTSTSASGSGSGSGQLENDDTDSTTSVATIHLPTKIVIEDDDEISTVKAEEEEDGEKLDLEGGCNNVFFFGEIRIDYQCHRVGNNMVVHYTSRKIASNNGKVASKIQRRGVITDIEYGPGIVQKLREKFSKMASTVIETAQLSPHAKQKKFPSVDDILTENEQRHSEHKRQEFNDQTQQEQPKPYYYFHHDTKSKQTHHHELPSSPPLPSRSQSQPPPKSPPLPVATSEAQEPQQQESPRAVVEKTPLGPISALRAKFEQQAAARAHAFGAARQNFGSRSQSVNTLKQYEARKEVAATAIPKSTESLIHAYKPVPAEKPEKIEEIRFAPKIPEKRPSGFLPPPIPQSQEQQILKNHSDQKRETNYFGAAPKPVRVMDLISPPADPAPKEYHHINDRVLSSTTTKTETTNIPPTVHSPASSTASSDQSPPPEEPRLIHEESEESESFKDSASYEQYRTQAIEDDRSNERHAFAAIQRQKMTLTLPIGSPHQHHPQHPQHPQQQQQQYQRSNQFQEVRIGKPGSTPITGPTKLKLPSDNSGISEMQKLLNKFNAIREQKMHETTPTPEEEKPISLPTAIVPPVVQQPQPPKQQQVLKDNYSYSPNVYQETMVQSDWKIEEKKHQNIISISIGEQQQYLQQEFTYLDSRDDPTTTHHHHKQRMAPPPPPPPPLPPRGGTDQQQQQRKSLTSRWLESKQDSDEEGSTQQSYDVAETAASTTSTMTMASTNFGVGGVHSKPYGDNETIDEQTRRSLETMSVVKEEPEEETEEIGTVRLLSHRRTLDDDNGTVHRSDFLKSNYPYDSSESEEEEHPNAHLAAYGIHRLGIYEAPNASDGNPVRHSLLNLVAEEDIPELLQAMAEECHFVFDDCDRSNMPTTSGIIHTPAKRMERRKQRNVDRICFVDAHPEVFAYVDESAAYEEGEWSEGFPISYEEYKQIVEAANQETAQQHMDLANWRMLMEQKFSIQDEQIRALTEQQEREHGNIENQSTSSVAVAGSNLATQSKQQRDEELGVTSTYSYSTPSTTPLINQQCAQPLQMNLRQTDRETSAI